LSTSASILTLNDVSCATPDGRWLVSHLNIDLKKGEILIITGPNGTGKSTLLEVILQRRRCQTGTVELNLPPPAIHYLPQLQDSQTHMPFSLRDILRVSTSAAISDDDMAQPGLLSKSQLDLGWNGASGGERRRTLLTRTLLGNPELIVLDEPFNHLDDNSRETIVSALRHFVAMQNKCVILSTHDFPVELQTWSDPAPKRISL